MNNKEKRIRINDLLDECNGCKNKYDSAKVEKICAGCDIYKEMRLLADSLKREGKIQEQEKIKKKHNNFALTVEEYQSYKKRGFSDMAICRVNFISISALRYWKKKMNLTREREFFY